MSSVHITGRASSCDANFASLGCTLIPGVLSKAPATITTTGDAKSCDISVFTRAFLARFCDRGLEL